MKTLKRIAAMLLCVACLFVLAACGSQTACLSSDNPVNYLEEIPGEHRARFQTNMNGPFEQLDFPEERVGSYVIVASTPLSYEY